MWRARRLAAALALGSLVLGAAAVGTWAARPAIPERVPTLAPLIVSRAPTAQSWIEDTLRAGATLAGIFRERGVPRDALESAVSALAPVASPHRLRAGTPVRILRDAWDSVRAVEIWPDPDYRVWVERRGAGWRGELDPVGVRAETVAVAGVVRGSLYESALSEGWRPSREELERHVLPGLVDIFRWDLDFFRDLRTGDRFRALYEREVRSDGSLRGARVLAAEIARKGEVHRAVLFERLEAAEYFDLSGNPLRRAFLRAPLDYRRVTSRFAVQRRHPVLGRWRAHLGVDYGAPAGTAVHAVADGIVTRAGPWGSYGQMVELRHPNGIRTRYAHLASIPRAVRANRSVRQGEILGWVGSTGLADGPHLHYEMHVDGRPADPRRVKLPAGKPLPDSLRREFGATRDQLWLVLERASRPPVVAGGPRAERDPDFR